MAPKKHEQSEFTVTDRRLFTSEGELRGDAPEETEVKKAPAAVPEPAPTPAPVQATVIEGSPIEDPTIDDATLGDREMPTPPSSAEQEAQAAAYRQSSKDLDSQVELSGHSAKEFEMTFERFLASLYMTAMLQLGLMRQQGGQPQIDIIGARQTIDTLSLISEKTKGNLSAAEQNFLQNSLYELRMAYVEVTNALARPPQPGSPQFGAPEFGSPQFGPAAGIKGK
jgi:hypothetical protein